jgi:hypothetical protein
MHSEALSKLVNRPKWQTLLGVAAIFLVWFFTMRGALDRYSDLPVASSVLAGILNAAMIYILVSLINAPESVAKEIDRELGHQIEILDDELNTLKEKYVALQQEHAKLLKQKSTP